MGAGVVGIAIALRAGRPRQGTFLQNGKSGIGAHRAFYPENIRGFFPVHKAAGASNLTPHLYLVQRLRITGVLRHYPPPPHVPLRHGQGQSSNGHKMCLSDVRIVICSS
jgi:hypothetical protein